MLEESCVSQASTRAIVRCDGLPPRLVPRRTGVVLTTDTGHTVSALAGRIREQDTNRQRYLRQQIGDLSSTFVVITEPVEPFPKWPDRCLIWETSRPYCYLRATADDRILIGGKDTPFATAHQQESRLKKKAKQLVNRLHRLFPETELETAYAWAGTFGATG